MLSTFTNLFSTMQNAQRKNSKDVLVRHTRWTQSLMNVFLDQGLILGYSREDYQLLIQLNPELGILLNKYLNQVNASILEMMKSINYASKVKDLV